LRDEVQVGPDGTGTRLVTVMGKCSMMLSYGDEIG